MIAPKNGQISLISTSRIVRITVNILILSQYVLGEIVLSAPIQHRTPELIGHVVMGRTTVQDCDHLFGPGVHLTGGHPGGRRQWMVGRSGQRLTVDGFNAGPIGGPWVETFWIDRLPGEKKSVPTLDPKLLKDGLICLSWFSLTRRQLIQHIRRDHPNSVLKSNQLSFTVPTQSPKRSITVWLEFRKDRLDSLGADW